ncbi:ESPR-type extended signal peptide-containing protein, partial [Chelonobacter oris]|uniref:ESPR-type extended signal peptide-containing protein n=1 Tax=Chelonobacter oris TaxID=505317 RepID=UPI0024473FD5
MNKIYKVIWNKITNTWVVASELTRAHGKSATRSVSASSAVVGVTSNSIFSLKVLAVAIAAALLSSEAAAYGYNATGEQGNTNVVMGDGGNRAEAVGTNSTIVGAGAKGITAAKDDNKAEGATAFGSRATATGGAVAVGWNAQVVDFSGGISIGADTLTTGANAVSLGWVAKAAARNAMAIGVESSATGIKSIALGNHAQAIGQRSIAIGTRTEDRDTSPSPEAVAEDSIAMGTGSYTGGTSAVGIGQRTIAYGRNSVALGIRAKTADANNITTGNTTTRDSQVAIGDDSWAYGHQSIAIGLKSRANGLTSIAMGADAQATNTGAMAIGTQADAKGEDSFVVGFGAGSTADAKDSISIGSRSQVSIADGVAIGSDSLAARAAGQAGYNPNAEKVTTQGATWVATKAAVSIGSTNQTRQITNLAAGSQDTDAVNVVQLKALEEKPLKFAGDQGDAVERKLGETLKLNGGVIDPANVTTGNISVSANDAKDGFDIELAKNIELTEDG